MQNDMFADQIDRSQLDDNGLMKLQQSFNQEMIHHLRELHENGLAIYIPDNTPSLKNNKEIQQRFTKKAVCHPRAKHDMYKDEKGVWRCGQCEEVAQRHTITVLNKSKRVMEFEESHAGYFVKYARAWDQMIQGKNRPYRVAIYFIRDSFRSFDYINAAHLLHDMMKTSMYYKDDNMLYLMPEFLGYHVDKEKAGAIITIMSPTLSKLKDKIYDGIPTQDKTDKE